MTTYSTRAQYVEPGDTAAFLDPGVPEGLLDVPIKVESIARSETHCHITTSEGSSFDVLAICPVRIYE